jgi:hypothetical protein
MHGNMGRAGAGRGGVVSPHARTTAELKRPTPISSPYLTPSTTPWLISAQEAAAGCCSWGLAPWRGQQSRIALTHLVNLRHGQVACDWRVQGAMHQLLGQRHCRHCLQHRPDAQQLRGHLQQGRSPPRRDLVAQTSMSACGPGAGSSRRQIKLARSGRPASTRPASQPLHTRTHLDECQPGRGAPLRAAAGLPDVLQHLGLALRPRLETDAHLQHQAPSYVFRAKQAALAAPACMPAAPSTTTTLRYP